jgi:hypothetical protein
MFASKKCTMVQTLLIQVSAAPSMLLNSLIKNRGHYLHGQVIFQSKTLSLMSMQYKGSRHCHAQQKRNAKAGIFQETKNGRESVAQQAVKWRDP